MRAGSVINQTAGSASLVGQFVAYSGDGAGTLSLSDVARKARRADAVFFGEEHNDSTCNQIEAQLLGALARERRTSLVMEFFETDTQPALARYLATPTADPTDESAFRTNTRQGRHFATSHRPMIELCRAAGIPVIAANAPRRLVREFRTSGLDYAAFRSRLSADDQALLPNRLERLGGRYWDDFVKVMTSHGDDGTSAAASQPAQELRDRLERPYLAQSLWDESMANRMAMAREADPGRQAVLVVGCFHVEHAGGTRAKFAARRPADRSMTIVYRGVTELPRSIAPDDRGAGDVVIYGIKPPPEPKASSGPSSAPASAPASAPGPA